MSEIQPELLLFNSPRLMNVIARKFIIFPMVNSHVHEICPVCQDCPHLVPENVANKKVEISGVRNEFQVGSSLQNCMGMTSFGSP
ncbi:MAG: hypothetical protein K0U82_18920, partial [Planctomycetes bacterium]|nr:hypothetical protein [Planctomycetota bacterium]